VRKAFNVQIVSLWHLVPRHHPPHPDLQTRPWTCHDTDPYLRNAGGSGSARSSPRRCPSCATRPDPTASGTTST